MKDTEVIETLQSKLAMPGGRHLYGILGSYGQLVKFSQKLKDARTPEGDSFPEPISLNQGILKSIPDDEFRHLVENEAKRPEPTTKHVAKAFESFLRATLQKKGLAVLAHLELIFAYGLELNLFRTLAADDYRLILLLPGKRQGGSVIMFPDYSEGNYKLPTNLIADNHLWQITD